MDEVQKPSNSECDTQPFSFYKMENGARYGVVVKALCYKPVGSGFYSRRGH
jgi:hypothetical protein